MDAHSVFILSPTGDHNLFFFEFWAETKDIDTANNRRIDLLKEIALVVNQTINEYALRENFDLILYENVAFVNDEINITQEIIIEIEKL